MKRTRLPNSILSFISLGIILALMIAGLFFLYWILLIGAMVGIGLYSFAWIRHYFLSARRKNSTHTQTKPSGRIIEHEEHENRPPR